jgi:thioredoxin 2
MPVLVCPDCGAKNRVDERAERLQPVCGRCGARLSAAPAAPAAPVDITDATIDRLLNDAGDRPVLVDCWAAWCGPCRLIAPTIDQLAREANGQYLVAKLDVDANPRTANRYSIGSIPTLLIFRKGELAERLVGLRPKEQIAARLAAHGG